MHRLREGIPWIESDNCILKCVEGWLSYLSMLDPNQKVNPKGGSYPRYLESNQTMGMIKLYLLRIHYDGG